MEKQPFACTIPAWAVPAVRTAAAHGLVAGYPDGTFAPKKLTTRAEAVALLYRALMADVPTE
nr:hypothetical protein [Bacillota bacterium]